MNVSRIHHLKSRSDSKYGI